MSAIQFNQDLIGLYPLTGIHQNLSDLIPIERKRVFLVRHNRTVNGQRLGDISSDNLHRRLSVGQSGRILCSRMVAQSKEQAGSNKPLLQPDPTQPAGRTLAGLPLVTSPDAPEGLVWGVPKARAFVVLRSDVSVALDSSAFFTSDRVAVRVTMRVEFGFPHEAALVRVLQQDEA